MPFFLFCSLFMSFALEAQSRREDDFLMRVSFVKSIKELLMEIEMKENNLVVTVEKKFFDRFTLVSEAWADARYHCFYGGWPSTLIKSKGKNLCQNPKKTNSSYDQLACKENELQCQPLLFGKGLCVSFAQKSDRNKTFALCENKFQIVHNGNFDFLKNPSRKEVEDLRELTALAVTVCDKKRSDVCKKILEKLPSGLKALDEAHSQAVSKVIEVVLPPLAVVIKEECADPTHAHESLAKDISQVATKSLDEMYEDMKKEFQVSSFCDPLKIVNDPNDRPSGFYLYRLYADLRKMDFLNIQKGKKDYFYDDLARRYKLSPELKEEVLPILNAMAPGSDDIRRKLVAQAKGLILQNFLKNYKTDPDVADVVRTELVKNNIFTEDENGDIECPFVGKDAFMKAMSGREKVLKAHTGSIKNKDQLTIVDYSKPSNQRRLFVIDLKTKTVIHNTWVAHGAGEGSGPGVDGLGSSPKMSNEVGSTKSSDGFIIATAKATGKLYGPNVLLKGIDSNNTNLAPRQIVLHGWGSPLSSYTAGSQDYDLDTGDYGPVYDALERVKATDFKMMPTKDMEKAINSMSATITAGKYLGATEGCLGVPMINVKHLDRKGRDKTQIELLRDDLPGSIIFNYSGEQMRSNYF
jgi:hypothetical protein